MIGFKHLKPGMSFIEVVGAIALLSIFGTSLFLTQAHLFDRISIAQQKFIAALNMQKELIVCQKNILNELFEQKGPVTDSIKGTLKSFESPDMKVMVTVKSDFSKTKFEDFKNLYLLKAVAKSDQKDYGALYRFAFIPEVPKK